MAPLDWGVLVGYLIAIVSWGVWSGRGNEKTEDFFLAGRGMRWWAVGLSVMATQISAITFIGTTGQAYTDGMRFLVVYFALPFAMVILCVTVVPFFYRSGVTTAYQYLERRFDSRTRTLTSLIFLVQRGMSTGVTLYAPALVLSVILGLPEGATILVMGTATVAYVGYGGNKSVIWTDVVQMSVIWFGIFLCFGVAISQLPQGFSLRDSLALAQAAGRFNAADTTLSVTKPYTLWSGLIGGLFLMLSYFGCDQSQVQRYLSGSSLKQSRLSLLFNAFLKVPMQFIILLTGILVFVFYHFHEPPMLWNKVEAARLEQRLAPAELQDLKQRFAVAHAARRDAAQSFAEARHRGDASRDSATLAYLDAGQALDRVRKDAVGAIKKIDGLSEYNDTNYIFPTYILSRLPSGTVGLVIAVIFAAAMSALSGELNSLATASMVDFYQRFVHKEASDAHYLLASRLMTVFWGGFACLIAMRAGQLGSAIEVVNRFGSFFYGSILGVFALAVTPKATARGAFYGLFAGVGAVALAANIPVNLGNERIHFLWYNPIGAVSVFVTGLLISAMLPEQKA